MKGKIISDKLRIGLRYEKEIKKIAKILNGFSYYKSVFILEATKHYLSHHLIDTNTIDKELQNINQVYQGMWKHKHYKK